MRKKSVYTIKELSEHIPSVMKFKGEIVTTDTVKQLIDLADEWAEANNLELFSMLVVQGTIFIFQEKL
jgi:hypothetical protein